MARQRRTRLDPHQTNDARHARDEHTIDGSEVPTPAPTANPQAVGRAGEPQAGTPASTNQEAAISPGAANNPGPNGLPSGGASVAGCAGVPSPRHGLDVLARLLVALEPFHPPPGLDPGLYSRVRTDAQVIHRGCYGSDGTCGGQPNADAARLSSCLARAGAGYGSPEPVLRMVLAAHAGAEAVYQQWETPAWQAYLDQPSSYRQILGDLIPADFVSHAAAELARVAFRRGTNPTAADDWPVYLERRLARQGAESRAVTTGLPALDCMLGGGLRGLTFLGGLTGIGKTSLATFMVGAALRESADVAALYIQLDMNKEAIYGQIFSSLAASERTRQGTEPVPRAKGGLDALRPPEHLRRLRVLDRRNLPGDCVHEEWQDVMCEHLTEAIKGLQRLSGTQSVLLVVDNFQRVDVPGVADDRERDVYRLDLLTRILSSTACELHPAGMPILALSKIPKGRGPTNLVPDDLHGDSDLPSRASTVVFLEPDPSRAPRVPDVAPLIINVAKGRDGATRGKLPVDFFFREYLFRELGAGRLRSPAQVERLVRSATAARAGSPPPGQGRQAE